MTTSIRYPFFCNLLWRPKLNPIVKKLTIFRFSHVGPVTSKQPSNELVPKALPLLLLMRTYIATGSPIVPFFILLS